MLRDRLPTTILSLDPARWRAEFVTIIEDEADGNRFRRLFDRNHIVSEEVGPAPDVQEWTARE